MNTPKLEIVSFTVSSNFETYRGGEKSSHFVSMGLTVQGASMEEFSLLQLEAAYRVSVAAVQDALLRGALTVDQANDRIRDMQNNYEAMRASFEKRLAKRSEQTT